MKHTRTLCLAACLALALSCGGPKTDSTIGASSEVERRVESLLSRMTLAEKIGQMNQA